MAIGGWQAGWPLQWGGGPTPIEAMLEAMRANVGKGHAADEDDVEWRWREARAIGFAAISGLQEKALSQFEPRYATDALDFYRDLHNIPFGVPDQVVRDLADGILHGPEDVSLPSVEQELTRIDERFSLITRPWSRSGTTIPGRAFEDWANRLPFRIGSSGRGDTLYPNFSNAFEILVHFENGGLWPETPEDRLAVDRAAEYLDGATPSWCTYAILVTLASVDSSSIVWTPVAGG